MTSAAIGQFEADLVALNACVERAGVALGCEYATAEEYEQDIIRAHRKRRAFARNVSRLRLLLGATAVLSFAALVMLGVLR